MKTKTNNMILWIRKIPCFLFFSFVFLLQPSAVLAQVPHAFNYQAVARSNGEILKNTTMDVRLSILQGSESGTVVWTETQTVTTNDLGLFSLQAGSTTPVNLDWSTAPFFLKVETDLNDGNGFVEMGTTQLLSVPYALFAVDVANNDDADADPMNEIQDLQLNGTLLSLTLKGSPTVVDLSNYIDDADADPENEIQDLQLTGNILTITRNTSATQIDLSPYLDNPGWNKTGTDTLSYPGSVAVGTLQPLGSKLMVQGDDVTADEPLFEVKRKDGQTVFAVYNDSIRMYVNASPTGKGPKGGFAIGGFGATKGVYQDYLRVTPDSVRIYIDPADTKGIKGGFAIGGYGAAKGISREYLRVTDDSTRIYVKNPAKGARGGFAIGGFSAAKGTTGDYLSLTPDNYFIGNESGSNIAGGLYNSTLGYQSGMSLTTGSNNNLMGYQSGKFLTTGNNNNFIGYLAGYQNSIGSSNVFIGDMAGYSNIGATTSPNGSNNVMIGSGAGYSNLYGKSNILIGTSAGRSLTGTAGSGEGRGSYNIMIGYAAGYKSDGATNIFIGTGAGYNSTGDHWHNTMIGTHAGYFNSNGNCNTFLGYRAGEKNNGSFNVFLGQYAGYKETESNKLYIDIDSTLQPLIWGDFSTNDVTINGNLEVTGTFTNPSDIRLKKDIVALDHTLEKIKEIKAVRYSWDLENHPEIVADDHPQLGVIAQDVQPVFPELVKKGPNGYLSVDYPKLTVVLLEAIKEQQKIIESQDQKIEKLEKENIDIVALKKQIEELYRMMGVVQR